MKSSTRLGFVVAIAFCLASLWPEAIPAQEEAPAAVTAPADEEAAPDAAPADESEVTTRDPNRRTLQNRPPPPSSPPPAQTSSPTPPPRPSKPPPLRPGEASAPSATPDPSAPAPSSPRRPRANAVSEGSDPGASGAADADLPIPPGGMPPLPARPVRPTADSDQAPSADAPQPSSAPQLRRENARRNLKAETGSSTEGSSTAPQLLPQAPKRRLSTSESSGEGDEEAEEPGGARPPRLRTQADDEATAPFEEPVLKRPTKLVVENPGAKKIRKQAVGLSRLDAEAEGAPKGFREQLKRYWDIARKRFGSREERIGQLGEMDTVLTDLRTRLKSSPETADQLTDEQTLVQDTLRDRVIMGSPDVANATHALELKRLGLRPSAAAKVGDFQDDNLEGELRPLGSGAVNTVYLGKYRRGSGTFEGIFKAEDNGEAAPDAGIRIGIDFKGIPRLAYRNVATTRLDELLDFDDGGMTTASEMALHQGRLGTVSERAAGTSLVGPQVVGNKEVAHMKPADVDAIPPGAKRHVGVRDGKVYQLESSVYEVNYADPRLRRDLVRLQLVDSIAGQVDRHAGNYFVEQDAGGRVLGVKGIDNDLAWGSKQRKIQTADPELGIHLPNHLPPYVDRESYDSVMSLTPSRLRQQMNGLLTVEEVDAASERLAEVQTHLRQLQANGRVLDSLEAWTSPEVTTELTKPVKPGEFSTYVGRDIDIQNEKRASNPKLVLPYPLPETSSQASR